jgi:hypothetical protein
MTSPSPATATNEELVEDLRLHAFDDCGGKEIPTHIANIAADRIAELASGHTALLRENEVLREALLTAQLLTVAHRKRVEDKLDAILQAITCTESRTGSESKPGEDG